MLLLRWNQSPIARFRVVYILPVGVLCVINQRPVENPWGSNLSECFTAGYGDKSFTHANIPRRARSSHSGEGLLNQSNN